MWFFVKKVVIVSVPLIILFLPVFIYWRMICWSCSAHHTRVCACAFCLHRAFTAMALFQVFLGNVVSRVSSQYAHQ